MFYKGEDAIRVSTLRGKFRDLYRKECASNLVTRMFFFLSFFFGSSLHDRTLVQNVRPYHHCRYSFKSNVLRSLIL